MAKRYGFGAPKKHHYHCLKVVCVGDDSVGKSSLIKRYMHDSYEALTKTTIGADYYHKMVDVENNLVHLQIYDSGNEQSFMQFQSLYHNTDIAIVLFDLTDEKSVENVSKWINNIWENTDYDKFPVFVIVGNKCDLAGHKALVAKHGAFYIATSAKTGRNIKQVRPQNEETSIAVQIGDHGCNRTIEAATPTRTQPCQFTLLKLFKGNTPPRQ